MNILVAGGAGFIGSNFIQYVLRERPDARILNFDALTYAGNLENLSMLSGDARYAFREGRIEDAAALDAAITAFQPDAIINFAAETHVDRSIHGGASACVLSNVLGVQVILEAVRRHSIPRFVQVSTDEVYGALPLDSTEAFSETTPFAPNSPYSAGKAGGDLFCRAYFKTYGTPVIVTHASNNYGPYQYPEKLIPFFVMKALRNEALPLYGDGMNIRDWLHVEDHASALLAILERGRVGETYNIGANNERANIDIAKEILQILGKSETLLAFVADRPGHDRRYAVLSTKLEQELGWRPKYDAARFAEGLRETVEWYKIHTTWLDQVLAKSARINTHIKK